MQLDECRVYCPYCGEPLTLLLDPSEVGSSYVEDCQVCCRPMIVAVFADSSGDLEATVLSEDEQ